MNINVKNLGSTWILGEGCQHDGSDHTEEVIDYSPTQSEINTGTDHDEKYTVTISDGCEETIEPQQ